MAMTEPDEGYEYRRKEMMVHQYDPDEYHMLMHAIRRLNVIANKIDGTEKPDDYWKSYNTTPEIDKHDAFWIRMVIKNYLWELAELVEDYEGGEEN